MDKKLNDYEEEEIILAKQEIENNYKKIREMDKSSFRDCKKNICNIGICINDSEDSKCFPCNLTLEGDVNTALGDLYQHNINNTFCSNTKEYRNDHYYRKLRQIYNGEDFGNLNKISLEENAIVHKYKLEKKSIKTCNNTDSQCESGYVCVNGISSSPNNKCIPCDTSYELHSKYQYLYDDSEYPYKGIDLSKSHCEYENEDKMYNSYYKYSRDNLILNDNNSDIYESFGQSSQECNISFLQIIKIVIIIGILLYLIKYINKKKINIKSKKI